MEPDEEYEVVFTSEVRDVIEIIGHVPATQTDLLVGYEQYVNKHEMCSNDLLQKLEQVNREAIEKKFMSMMEEVYREIEPHLKYYKKEGSLRYLDQIIYTCLDKKIYPSSYRLHKSESTPMETMRQKGDITMIDNLFAQLFDIVYQLLQTFKSYYEVEGDQQIPEVIFQSLANFMEENENSYIVSEDRRSLLYEEERKSMIKEGMDKQKMYEEIGKVLSNFNKESNKKESNLVSSTVGAVTNYVFSSSAGFISSQIKKINPFSYLQKEASSQEKQKIKTELISHLNPRLSVKEALDEKIVQFLMKLVPHRPQAILANLSKEQKQSLSSAISELLSEYKHCSDNFEEIVREMMSLCNESEELQSKVIKVKEEYKEAVWVILLYKVLERNYNPERRRVLFYFCNLPCIKSKLSNSIAIVKFIESEELPSNSILNLLRTMPVKKKDEQKKFQLSKKKTDDLSKAIEHELHHIHVYELQKKFQDYPLIQFQRLTLSPPKRVITIVFSGFMSQDSCKVQEWDRMLEPIYDSEVYSLRWESKTFGDMFDFAVDAGKNILEANLKIGFLSNLGGPYLRAIAIIREIYKKYKNNPFNPAFESAVKTGKFLAEFFTRNFQGYFLNLIGFSLGTELIKNILEGLALRNQLSMVNKVYLMGGVADKNELEHIIINSKSSLSLINLYSENDSILKYLLKVCKPNLVPVGLNPVKEIEGHEIVNMDCTPFINGHLAYREELNVLSTLLNMKDD